MEVSREIKGLPEIMSLEVPVESVGIIAGVQCWRQRIPDCKRCDREATSA